MLPSIRSVSAANPSPIIAVASKPALLGMIWSKSMKP
jgi:hypothetical protein